MSSHDSVGLVFKCLSKGAVDFLLKPIRKNELKNLWQHVWRRCQSSSGSGSESGTQTQKSIKSKSSEQYGNNSGSNDGEDNQRNGPLGNGSNDGSGTLSSWPKQAVEVDSSLALSPCNQALKHGDSTRAQVIRSNAETSSIEDNTGKGNCSLRDPKIEPENAIEVPHKHLGTRHRSALEIDSNASSLKAIGCFAPSEHHEQFDEMSYPQIDSREFNKVAESLEINNTSTDDSKHCVVELRLKRLRDLRESGTTFQDNRNVLRRSELSAFSRYNSSSSHTRIPNGIIQGGSLIENILEIANKESVHDIETHMSDNLLVPRSNGVSNNVALGSTTNILISKPLPHRDSILGMDGPHCGSLSILAGSCEGNPEYHSLNRSASGSNHGTDGQTGICKAVNDRGTNGNSDTGLAHMSRSGGDASGSGSGNTMDPFKLARAAALTKFRQKRKERCFTKKVQYQNRKRLPEQQPRVRGQFISTDRAKLP